jgi:hypothetical protein
MKKLLYLFAFFLFSCTQDAYEKGEGKYSLMRGDFAEASINSDKQIVSITTDEGELLPLKERWKAKWIETADTTYRCILYYNKVEDQSGKQQAEIISIGQVPCPRVVPLSEFDKELKTDPVKFESIWLSRSGKYLNMSLQLMTGYTEDTTAIQKLSFVADTLVTYPDSKRTLHFCLHHDQNGVPEYYTTQAYVSLLVDSLHADSVHLTINTYKGSIDKILPLSK